jgi:hypothetical protein
MVDQKAGILLLDRSEQPIDAVTPSAVGTISDQVCYGRMYFLKRNSGGEIYIGFANKQPTPQSYNIVLTDSLPAWDGYVVIGDIKALSSVAGGVLTSFASGGLWNK